VVAVRGKGKRETLVQTGLRLDADVLDLLRGGGRSVSDEVRHRLERTFIEDGIDAATRELRVGLVHIAAKLRQDYNAEWHASSKAREAFSAAIVERLKAYAFLAKKTPSAEERLFAPRGSPADIGRIRETEDRHLNSNSYPLLNSSPPASHRLDARRSSRRESDND
jgi:hypothetical protein